MGSENKAKILITGPTGNIGMHLIRVLTGQGYRCRCLVRRTSNISELEKLGVEIFYGDVCNPKTLTGITEGIDIVYHLAAIGHVSSITLSSYREFKRVNVEGTRNILEECRKSAVRKFIHFSSTAAMGLIENVVVNEDTSPIPTTPYQKTKLESEQVVMDYHKKYGIPVVILRPCMVYGEECFGEYLRIFSYIKRGILPKIGKGKKLTPLTYIYNILPAIINAADLGKPGNVYLLVDGSVEMDVLHEKVCRYIGKKTPYIYIPSFIAFTLAKIYEVVCRLAGGNPKISLKNVKSTVANRIFDSTKARQELQFESHIGLDESLKKTIEWAKSKRYL